MSDHCSVLCLDTLILILSFEQRPYRSVHCEGGGTGLERGAGKDQGRNQDRDRKEGHGKDLVRSFTSYVCEAATGSFRTLSYISLNLFSISHLTLYYRVTS